MGGEGEEETWQEKELKRLAENIHALRNDTNVLGLRLTEKMLGGFKDLEESLGKKFLNAKGDTDEQFKELEIKVARLETHNNTLKSVIGVIGAGMMAVVGALTMWIFNKIMGKGDK